MNLIIEERRGKLVAKLEELKRVEKLESQEKEVAFNCITGMFLKLCYYYNKSYMKDYRMAIRKIVKMIQREFEVIENPDLEELMSSNFNKFIDEIIKNYDKIKNIENDTTEDNKI